MDICALKTAIVDCCISEDFTPEKIEVLIIEFRANFKDEKHLKICSLAAKAVNTPLWFMLSKTRKVEPVIARRLVFVYYKSKGLTLEACGKKFGQDHATAKHGISAITNDIITGHDLTVGSAITFSKLIKEYENYTIKANGFNS